MEDWKKTKCGTCIFQRGKPICNSCIGYSFYRPMTNADRIRAMSDEELAEFLEGVNRDYDISYGEYFSTKAGDFIFSKTNLGKEILNWLQSEAE